MTRTALYARVSTVDQTTENQLLAMRAYCARAGWTVVAEYVDDGVSGTTRSRPALDVLVKDAQRGRFERLVVWRLDRLGRSLPHLVLLLDELRARHVTFASVHEGLDLSTPQGVLMMHMLAALAEYERALISDRVKLGLARARQRGTRSGRPIGRPKDRARKKLPKVAHLSLKDAARALGVGKSTISKWRSEDGVR